MRGCTSKQKTRSGDLCSAVSSRRHPQKRPLIELLNSRIDKPIRRWCDGVAVSPDEVLKRKRVKVLLGA